MENYYPVLDFERAKCANCQKPVEETEALCLNCERMMKEYAECYLQLQDSSLDLR